MTEQMDRLLKQIGNVDMDKITTGREVFKQVDWLITEAWEVMSSAEGDFVNDLFIRAGQGQKDFSEKQKTWLTKIYAKYGGPEI